MHRMPTPFIISRRGLLGVAGTTLLAAPALGQSAPRPPAQPKGQVIIGVSQEPTRFLPLTPAIEVDQGVWWNLFSPLWNVQPDGSYEPVLAREVPSVANGGISADGLVWRVRLREGVKWHDGAAFTADDVKFTLDLINNPDFRAGSRNGHNLVRDIEVKGPHEITWRMEQPYAPYLSRLAWTFIVPKHALEKVQDINNPPFLSAPIGTGPFKWGERVPGDHITLLANRDYFGDGPYLERLVLKYIPDLTVMYTQFRTGEIDHTSIQGITPDLYQEARTLRDRVVSKTPSASVESISVNLGWSFMDEKPVREALYLAMNKKALIDVIYYGIPEPTESFYPKQSAFYNPDLPRQEYNPKKANEILDAAGWVRGSDGIRSKNGVRLAFTNSTTAGNQVREQAQQLLMQDWKAIGAAMSINNMPAAVIWGDFWGMSKFQSVIVGVNFAIGADPDVTDRFASTSIPAKGGSGRNTYQYANPDVDALLKAGMTEFDPARRKAIYLKLQEHIRADLPILPIYQAASVEGLKKGLIGYRSNINTQSNCWNCGTWYWAS